MEHEELTDNIISCAYRVYNKLGYGFLESVFGKALLIELQRAGLKVCWQIAITVHYDGIDVGEFAADVLVEDLILLELKSVRELAPAHGAQLLNYLTAKRKPVGLLNNFGEHCVQIQRKHLYYRAPSDPDSDPVNPVDPLDPVQ